MNSHFYHIQININFKNAPFYSGLFSFLGWTIIHEEQNTLGYKNNISGDIWFYDDGKPKEQSDYDNLGMNHLAIRVETEQNIDSIVTYLKNAKTKTLFGTPRHRPEFALSEAETYYQVMFKSPDNILFEIIYLGKKSS